MTKVTRYVVTHATGSQTAFKSRRAAQRFIKTSMQPKRYSLKKMKLELLTPFSRGFIKRHPFTAGGAIRKVGGRYIVIFKGKSTGYKNRFIGNTKTKREAQKILDSKLG